MQNISHASNYIRLKPEYSVTEETQSKAVVSQTPAAPPSLSVTQHEVSPAATVPSQLRSTSTQYQDVELELQTRSDVNTTFCVKQEITTPSPLDRVKHRQSKVIVTATHIPKKIC